MKIAASIQTPMFFNSTLPMTGAWGTTSQRINSRARIAPRQPRLTTDEFAASKSEVVCGGILALCFFYTLATCFFQFA